MTYESQLLPMRLRAIATERADGVAINILTHSAEALEKMTAEIDRLRAEREALWVNGVMTGAEIALARAMDICRPVPGPEPRDWQLHRARIALREFLCDQLQKQNVELLEAEARRRWKEREK